MNKETKTPTEPQAAVPVNPIQPGVPQQKISKPLIIAATIGSTLIVLALYALLTWAEIESESQAPTTTASTETDATALIIILAIACTVVLLPGIIVALIVLPKLLKNRKK